MAIDPVKIPQNVQIEDKVIGPLSLRQIIIMAIGGGFSYTLYASVQRMAGHVSIPVTVIVWLPALIAAAFAMVNINDLSLLRICFLLAEKMQKPSTRTWAPRTGITINFRTSSAKENEAKNAAETAQQANTQKQIGELSQIVDRVASAPIVASTSTPDLIESDIVRETPVSAPQAMTADVEDPIPAPRAPVDPSRIQTDAAHPSMPQLSDLSVFRDVIPPTQPWQH